MMAGYVESKVASASWEDLVWQRIFTPLNMTRSNVSAVELQASADFAVPHDMVNGKPQPTASYDYQKLGVGPNGAVNASVSDMLKHLAFQLSHGTVDGKRVVSSAQLQHLHTPSVLVSGDTRYGFGWVVESYHGHTVLQHGGSVHGCTSHMLLLPDDGIAIVVLNNVASSLPRTISSSLRDRLLGLIPDDYLGKTLAQSKQDRQNDVQRRMTFDAKASDHSPLPLAAYAVTYFRPAYGDIHVTVQGNGLVVHFDAYELQLRQYQHGTFAWDENLAQFQFDSSSNVTELLLPLEPSLKPFKFLRTSK
jgi:CubicO group peptidase (beta-lactamase class C family)